MSLHYLHLFILLFVHGISCSPDANRLFEDLLKYYNKWVRPVKISKTPVNILFKLKLLQILDVHEKEQMLTTSGRLSHIWHDYRMKWEPSHYGNLTIMHIPAQLLWLPDIILYNNADGSPQVTQITKAHVHHTGVIEWEPPVIYNSMCPMNIQYFPYDEQYCEMKFGSWSYYATELVMNHLKNDTVVKSVNEVNETITTVELGVNLEEFQESVEWDLMAIPAIRRYKAYTCCPNQSVDITYNITLRRKTLFFTINLIVPCGGMTILSCLVFYLPPESNNKISLSVSVLVTLTVFFLLLVEIVPPTSVTVPLIGKFLLLTMSLVSLSVCVTVVVISIHYRTGKVDPMPNWVRLVFTCWIPSLLGLTRPKNKFNAKHEKLKRLIDKVDDLKYFANKLQVNHAFSYDKMKAKMIAPYQNIIYIAEYFHHLENAERSSRDWKYVAMVIDRVLLLLFTIAIVFGTLIVFATVPVFQDKRFPVTELLKYNRTKFSTT